MLKTHAIAQHSSRLEWIIIVLIAVEIIIELKDMYAKDAKEKAAAAVAAAGAATASAEDARRAVVRDGSVA